MKFATCDLCDAHEDALADGRLRVLQPGFLLLGQARRFAGPAATLKVFEDNSRVRTALETPGEGRVLVVDGGGSVRCALVGGNLAQLGEKNGWAGIVVNGAVRDTEELEVCEIGIRALATNPRKSVKLGAGQTDLIVDIAGELVRPGEWIYSDIDGILVSTEPLV
ncbi:MULTISPECIES: ribonuclease E activity regulator RraA [unclassified Pandoraea]|uniref:ribonuclease E activity regulator RraA n=1 Tax=unclassified Pandoraea TaxID=2624094 RepID=UPI000B401867|nr:MULTISPECIES: ribonuclease E activity regulator RraA [unclassified Pandoraea]